MTSPTTSTHRDPVVQLLSLRGTHKEVYRCREYEFEDVLSEVTDARMIVASHATRAGELGERVANRSLRLTSGRVRGPRPFSAEHPPESPADVLILDCQRPSDLIVVSALGDLRRFADRTILFIEEAFVVDLEHWRGQRSIIELFDHVFIGNNETVEAWQPSFAVPLGFLPLAVDVLRYSPRTADRDRPIAVVNFGRRSDVTHEALFRWAVGSDEWYQFDSYRVGECWDHRQHRHVLATYLQRARISICNAGVGADPVRTRGQSDMPGRYFESAAAGAVLLGARPNGVGMETHFDWPDAHLEMALDSPDAGEVVAALLRDGDRLAAASRRNIVESLRRHDHLHRIETMFETLGVPLGPSAEARRALLAERVAVHEFA